MNHNIGAFLIAIFMSIVIQVLVKDLTGSVWVAILISFVILTPLGHYFYRYNEWPFEKESK
jgi:peptidoglycan/LPS O-acetylase OafA/YrhL